MVQAFKGLLDGSLPVAVLQLHANVDARQILALKSEIASLQALPKRHIVQCRGICLQPSQAMIILERMEGSLWDALAQNDKCLTGNLGWYQR